MKGKNFKKYLEKRLDKNEIQQIEQAAQIEFEIFTMLQQDVAKDLAKYMSDNQIGFNELVRKMGKSPTQVSKIIKGEANLTMTTIAQVYALLGQKVHITSK